MPNFLKSCFKLRKRKKRNNKEVEKCLKLYSDVTTEEPPVEVAEHNQSVVNLNPTGHYETEELTLINSNLLCAGGSNLRNDSEYGITNDPILSAVVSSDHKDIRETDAKSSPPTGQTHSANLKLALTDVIDHGYEDAQQNMNEASVQTVKSDSSMNVSKTNETNNVSQLKDQVSDVKSDASHCHRTQEDKAKFENSKKDLVSNSKDGDFNHLKKLSNEREVDNNVSENDDDSENCKSLMLCMKRKCESYEAINSNQTETKSTEEQSPKNKMAHENMEIKIPLFRFSTSAFVEEKNSYNSTKSILEMLKEITMVKDDVCSKNGILLIGDGKKIVDISPANEVKQDKDMLDGSELNYENTIRSKYKNSCSLEYITHAYDDINIERSSDVNAQNSGDSINAENSFPNPLDESLHLNALLISENTVSSEDSNIADNEFESDILFENEQDCLKLSTSTDIASNDTLNHKETFVDRVLGSNNSNCQSNSKSDFVALGGEKTCQESSLEFRISPINSQIEINAEGSEHVGNCENGDEKRFWNINANSCEQKEENLEKQEYFNGSKENSLKQNGNAVLIQEEIEEANESNDEFLLNISEEIKSILQSETIDIGTFYERKLNEKDSLIDDPEIYSSNSICLLNGKEIETSKTDAETHNKMEADLTKTEYEPVIEKLDNANQNETTTLSLEGTYVQDGYQLETPNTCGLQTGRLEFNSYQSEIQNCCKPELQNHRTELANSFQLGMGKCHGCAIEAKDECAHLLTKCTKTKDEYGTKCEKDAVTQSFYCSDSILGADSNDDCLREMKCEPNLPNNIQKEFKFMNGFSFSGDQDMTKTIYNSFLHDSCSGYQDINHSSLYNATENSFQTENAYSGPRRIRLSNQEGHFEPNSAVRSLHGSELHESKGCSNLDKIDIWKNACENTSGDIKTRNASDTENNADTDASVKNRRSLKQRSIHSVSSCSESGDSSQFLERGDIQEPLRNVTKSESFISAWGDNESVHNGMPPNAGSYRFRSRRLRNKRRGREHKSAIQVKQKKSPKTLEECKLTASIPHKEDFPSKRSNDFPRSNNTSKKISNSPMDEVKKCRDGIPSKLYATNFNSDKIMLKRRLADPNPNAVNLKGIEIKRKESIQEFSNLKVRAISDMRPVIREIPIQKTKSYEFKLGTFENDFIYRKDRPFVKIPVLRVKDDLEKNNEDLENQEKMEYTMKWNASKTRRGVSGKNLRLLPETKTEPSLQTSSKTLRKKILDTSREIQSPKYPLKCSRRTRSKLPYKTRPFIITKGNLIAYVTKDDKSNIYRIKKDYKIFNTRSGKRNNRVYDSKIKSFNSANFIRQQMYPGAQNRTTSPDDLKTAFDDKFKRYARRGRSNGELMSYKRSTEWLKDAGVIGKILTAEEADDAFKCTAGVKVALNRGDYRHFLKKLARLKRLNYNGIYERLCLASDK